MITVELTNDLGRRLCMDYAHPVTWHGRTFRSAMHAWAWAMTTDHALKERVFNMVKPRAALHLASRGPRRPDWTKHEAAAVASILAAKFEDDHMQRALDATAGHALAYISTDLTWGCEPDPNDPVGETMRGQNALGLMLMALRDGNVAGVKPAAESSGV